MSALARLRGLAVGIVIVTAALAGGAADRVWAHHGDSTARVNDAPGWSGASSFGLVAPLPRLSLMMLYGTRYFGRVLEGTAPYEKSELGRVFLNTLGLRVSLELESRTMIGFYIPVGVVDVSAAGGGHNFSGGLGDIEIYAGQTLGPLWGAEPGRFSVAIRGGLVTNTGHYEPEAGLTVTDVTGAPDGSVGVVTYNTQASLGADSWSPFATIGVRWQPLGRLVLVADGTARAPVTRTRDDIRWGPDISTRAGIGAAVVRDRVNVMATIDYRHHFRDQVPVEDEATGATSFRRVGGHDEVAVNVGLQIGLGGRVTCSIDVRAPTWQRVGGIQLVETISGAAACAVAWGL